MNWCTLFLFALLTSGALASVEEDWQQIVNLDAGPKATWKTREEARATTLAFLERQEKALRDFVAKYPTDPHTFEARLRLVHLLGTLGDLQNSAKPRVEAMDLLNRLEKEAPPEKVADVEFARISLFMRQMSRADENARAILLNKTKAFAEKFPADRRIAALFAEVATLYDSKPEQKKELLETALASAKNADLKQRIEDDLKRIAFLGNPVPLAFTSTSGTAIDVKNFRGKVVFVYFFASWSPPSMEELDVVRDLSAAYPAGSVQALGINLDANRFAVDAALRTRSINWPVFCDGKGWLSPLVRSLGINTLPTLWILDRAGRLRTLNAHEEAPALISQLLRER